MIQDTQLLQRRFAELAQRSYAGGVYTHTGFLSLFEQSVLAQQYKSLSFVPHALFGGMEGCERKLARFGDATLCGYEADWPIACIKIAPTGAKFADALTHRDFLGALMHLGVERDTLGDIIAREQTGYVFCMERIAPYLLENITQIGHTFVHAETADALPEGALFALNPMQIQVSSPRIDAVVGKVYKLSREDSQQLFREKRVFINSALCENNSRLLEGAEVVSVRGFGRFVYNGITGLSKKGKTNASISLYQS